MKGGDERLASSMQLRTDEPLCHHDLAHRCLTGLEVINAHTLSDFRVGHGEARATLLAVVAAVSSAWLAKVKREALWAAVT